MTTANHIDNTSDILDVRDLIARIEELRSLRDDYTETRDAYNESRACVEYHHSDIPFMDALTQRSRYPEVQEAVQAMQAYKEAVGVTEGEAAELEELESLLADLQGMGGDEQWEGNWYPTTLIRDSYFKDYAQELAEEIGAVDEKATWPMNCIDWDQAASELRYDYSAVYIGEVTYWTR